MSGFPASGRKKRKLLVLGIAAVLLAVASGSRFGAGMALFFFVAYLFSNMGAFLSVAVVETAGEQPTLQGVRNLVRRFVEVHDDVMVFFPVHPNPEVRAAVDEALGGAHERIRLLPPWGYADFVHLLAAAWLIVSDSGGIQEEAPTLGKPVLVMRETTERPEGIEAEADAQHAVAAACRLRLQSLFAGAEIDRAPVAGQGHVEEEHEVGVLESPARDHEVLVFAHPHEGAVVERAAAQPDRVPQPRTPHQR